MSESTTDYGEGRGSEEECPEKCFEEIRRKREGGELVPIEWRSLLINPLITSNLKVRYVVIIPVLDTYQNVCGRTLVKATRWSSSRSIEPKCDFDWHDHIQRFPFRPDRWVELPMRHRINRLAGQSATQTLD